MNQRFQQVFRTCLTAVLACSALSISLAGEIREFKHVIKVQTDGSDVIEADVSGMQPGEAMSFTTDSGKMVDILKSVDEFEIYIDGEQVAGPPAAEQRQAHAALVHERMVTCEATDAQVCEGQHGQAIHRKVEIHCDSETAGDCDSLIVSGGEADLVLEEIMDEQIIVIRTTQEEIHTD